MEDGGAIRCVDRCARMEDGARYGAWTGVGRGRGWKTEGCDTVRGPVWAGGGWKTEGCDTVWTGVRGWKTEGRDTVRGPEWAGGGDGRQRGVRRRADLAGRRRGAIQGADRCAWKTEGLDPVEQGGSLLSEKAACHGSGFNTFSAARPGSKTGE